MAAKPKQGVTISAADVPLLPFESGAATSSTVEDSLMDFLASDDETPGESREPAAKAADPEIDEDIVDDLGDEGSDEGEELDAGGEEEPEPKAQDDQGQKFKVKVDGQEVEVTLDELTRGYSRQSDYTRKTQELAARRKEADAEFTQIREAREQYIGGLDRLEKLVEAQMPAEPTAEEWEALRLQDPGEFAALKQEFAEHRQRLSQIGMAKQEEIRKAQAAEAAQLERIRAEERTKLAEAVPEWKDEKHRNSVREYAHQLGFTDENLAGVVDHRVLVLLDKAFRFDALQSRAKETVQKAKEVADVVLEPGARQPNPKQAEQNKRLQTAKRRLSQTGRVRDAAAAIALLD